MKIVVKDRKFPSATGLGMIRYRVWIPQAPCAALQITHGMAEHIERYDAFARFLAGNGVLVYGQDHAGHGRSTENSPRGYFGVSNGWNALLDDIKTLYQTMKDDFPAIPFVLFGHSMGSFLARAFAARNKDDFDAYIFSGSAGKNPVLGIAKLIAKMEIKKLGASKPSFLLNDLSFGSYNKAIGENRTQFDWLSRDHGQVDKYVADENCGFVFSAAGMRDLFDGLSEVSSKRWAVQVPAKPIFMISGDCDPVGGKMGKGIKQIEKWLRQTGHVVETKLYPNARHELLNELNFEEVFGDVLLFIETVGAMGEIV